MAYVAGLLDEVGLGGERVTMVNLSSAMGAQFAEVVAEVTERVRRLGPNPLGNTREHEGTQGNTRRYEQRGRA